MNLVSIVIPTLQAPHMFVLSARETKSSMNNEQFHQRIHKLLVSFLLYFIPFCIISSAIFALTSNKKREREREREKGEREFGLNRLCRNNNDD